MCLRERRWLLELAGRLVLIESVFLPTREKTNVGNEKRMKLHLKRWKNSYHYALSITAIKKEQILLYSSWDNWFQLDSLTGPNTVWSRPHLLWF